MERRGCKKVGRVQVFLDGPLGGNSRGRTAGGRQVREKVLEVRGSERLMVVRVIVWKTVLNLICARATS